MNDITSASGAARWRNIRWDRDNGTDSDFIFLSLQVPDSGILTVEVLCRFDGSFHPLFKARLLCAAFPSHGILGWTLYKHQNQQIRYSGHRCVQQPRRYHCSIDHLVDEEAARGGQRDDMTTCEVFCSVALNIVARCRTTCRQEKRRVMA